MRTPRAPIGGGPRAGAGSPGQLECPYHGFRYDAAGACTLTPCEGAKAKPSRALCLRLHPVRVAEEAGGRTRDGAALRDSHPLSRRAPSALLAAVAGGRGLHPRGRRAHLGLRALSLAPLRLARPRGAGASGLGTRRLASPARGGTRRARGRRRHIEVVPPMAHPRFSGLPACPSRGKARTTLLARVAGVAERKCCIFQGNAAQPLHGPPAPSVGCASFTYPQWHII